MAVPPDTGLVDSKTCAVQPLSLNRRKWTVPVGLEPLSRVAVSLTRMEFPCPPPEPPAWVERVGDAFSTVDISRSALHGDVTDGWLPSPA